MSKNKFIFISIFLGAVLLSIMLRCNRSAWPHLERFDPSLAILNQPEKLMALIVEDSEKRETELKSEALKRLIAKQLETFKRLESSQQAAGIDHEYIVVVSTNESQVTLLCTPPQSKRIHAPEGSYWAIEYLTFDWSGTLLKRDPYIEKAGEGPAAR